MAPILPVQEQRCAVGPVIGRVTTDTARVLVELGFSADSLTVELTHIHRHTSIPGASFRVTKSAVAGRPVVFPFSGLTSGKEYRVSVSANGAALQHVASSLRTQAQPGHAHSAASIGVVSCNKIYVTEAIVRRKETDAWSVLQQRLEKEGLDVLLHVGDQVYIDHEYYLATPGAEQVYTMPELQAKLKGEGANCAFLDAKLLVEAASRDKWASDVLPAVLEIFRDVYRRTWSWGATAAVLANCQNIMIPDDHEFRDDWGDKRNDYDHDSVDFFLAHAAYQVYREYQAALLDDVPPVPAAHLPEVVAAYITMPQLLAAHGVGLLTLDSRVKSFRQAAYPYDGAEATPLLGAEQWRATLAALADGGSLAGTRVLIVAVGIPPCWMGAAVTEIAAEKIDDLKGAWGHPRNQPELLRLLDALCTWKMSDALRQVVVVAGDVHCGAITDIKKDGSTIFRQLVASPIANKIMSRTQRILATLAAEIGTELNENFSFNHVLHEHRCQFGMVTVPAATKSGTLPVDLQLELVGVGEQDMAADVQRKVTNAIVGRGCCTVA